MTIKNKTKIVLPAIAAVVALSGLVTAVSAQVGNPQGAIDALKEQMVQRTQKAFQNGEFTIDEKHGGEKVVTGQAAADLDALQQQYSDAVEATIARPASERAAAVAKIRAFTGNPAANPDYVSTARSSYNHKVNTEFYTVGQDYVEVDMRTNEIVQIGPAPVAKGQSAKTYNTEARFTPAQLEAKAREFIAKNAPSANLSTLKASVGEKSGTNYFFRFTDESRRVDDMQPFVQVGFTVGGDLLSYTNTLGL